MLSYLSFCVYQPLPAAALTLNRYASFLERSPSASSIPAYLNAVRILQLEHGLTHPTKNNFLLATTLRGIKRLKGLTVLQKKPITPQILLAFKSHLNLDNPLHATFWAVCLVVSLASYVKRICHAKVSHSFTRPNTSVGETYSSLLTGPSLSIDGRRPSNLVSAFQLPLPGVAQRPLCPYTALRHAFRLVPAPLSGPAFIIPASTGGGLTPLTYGQFDSRLKLLAAKTIIDPSQVSGHSLRSGVATLAFQAQIPAELKSV